MDYQFRKAKGSEVPTVFAMITDRVHWMDEKGIQQWNTTDYLNVYPLTYYQDNLSRLYVLAEDVNDQILCAAILLDEDERWNSEESAFYLHNFVSVTNSCGSGRIFIQYAEQYAARQEKRYLRLDSSDDNEKLSQYYESMGYMACGSCQEGPYHGTLRQKKIR